jgi:hypothetical protein
MLRSHSIGALAALLLAALASFAWAGPGLVTTTRQTGSFPRPVQQADTRFTWTVQFTALETSNWSFTGNLAGSASGVGAQTSLKIGVFNGSGTDQTQTFTGNFDLSNQTLGGTIAPGGYSFIVDAHSLVDFPNGQGLSQASFAVSSGQFAVPEPGTGLALLCGAVGLLARRRADG